MKKTKLYLLFSAIAMVLLTAGVSYAWLARQQASMDTLLSILPPDTIVIIPVSEGGEPMTELDLDYRDQEIYGGYDYIDTDEDGNKTIHILRPVCVKSSYPAHRLEVVRTTNLNELQFHIYSAPWNSNPGKFELPAEEQRIELSGDYINDIDDAGKLAIQDKTLNGNYQSTDIVEAHAYPLYWLAGKPCKAASKILPEDAEKFVSVLPEIRENEDDPHTGEKKDFYCTYYYLEISWKEITKQTDLFYILAQNVA